MLRRYANRFVGKRAEKAEQKVISINENNFSGDIYFYNFLEVKDKMLISNGLA